MTAGLAKAVLPPWLVTGDRLGCRPASCADAAANCRNGSWRTALRAGCSGCVVQHRGVPAPQVPVHESALGGGRNEPVVGARVRSGGPRNEIGQATAGLIQQCSRSVRCCWLCRPILIGTA